MLPHQSARSSVIGALLLIAILLLAPSHACGLLDESGGSNSGSKQDPAQRIDDALARGFACITDDEKDDNEASLCLYNIAALLEQMLAEGLPSHEGKIARRFLVIIEPGTLLIEIQSGITQLRQDLIAGQ